MPITPASAMPARSPQARGSTAPPSSRASIAIPFPAGAGINRSPRSPATPGRSVPRRRGDQPATPKFGELIRRRSPQARGSTGAAGPPAGLSAPFPAGAGINRTVRKRSKGVMAVPRRRGDQPSTPSSSTSWRSRSPQARGSTVIALVALGDVIPFPACAGINRRSRRDPCRWPTVPRRSGDQPFVLNSGDPFIVRSPHVRGSTDHHRFPESIMKPFPACAGINRSRRSGASTTTAVPRRRGGQPSGERLAPGWILRSPQARGSTVHGGEARAFRNPFPAGAGINR